MQASIQDAVTQQVAGALSASGQTAVNGNAPVTIAAGDVSSGPSSANQAADSSAKAAAGNAAKTDQSSSQDQSVGGSSHCYAGCGGAGAAQANEQKAATLQLAAAKGLSDQTAVNGNAPVTIAGGDVSSGPSSANQAADSKGAAWAGNLGGTWQGARQDQTAGS